ncbi:hypothetical protein TNCV_2920691 [Trichonephila clavipes]|nr:hypothetical protein TNCV_2920691 [Trichonephila clavipes]
MDAYFSNAQSVIASQRTFRRLFDIPPRIHVHDRKCVLMWNDAFRATRNVSKKKGKNLRKPLEHLKIWKEAVCQFKSVCDNDLTIVLILAPGKGS